MVACDKKLIQGRFAKNYDSYNQIATVQQHVAQRLTQILQIFSPPEFKHLLEIGCGTGFLTKQILQNCKVQNFILNDLVAKSEQEVIKYTGCNNFTFIEGDAEIVPFPEQLNAIVSASTFQWFSDMCNFFNKARHHLSNEGFLAFSTYGQQNFIELKSTMQVGLNYFGLNELTCMLMYDFEILHTEEWVEVHQFDSPRAVLKHIKDTGVNGISCEPFTRQSLFNFEKQYTEKYSDGSGRVSLTYHPIIVIAKRR